MTRAHAHPSTPLARARVRILLWLAFWNGGEVPTVAEVRQFVFWSVIGTVVAWAVVVMLFGLTRYVGEVLS